ncbi:MAG TPA: hypothetical protein VF981_07575 [Gemmatimonadaceae bacterium]
MPAQQAEWTADMARALPDDGNWSEVLDGELHSNATGIASRQRHGV